MQQRSTPLLLLLVGALALGQVPRLSPGAPATTATPASPRASDATATATAAKDEKSQEPYDWKEPIRLYREFFGIRIPPPAKDTLAVEERAAGSKVEYALVRKSGTAPALVADVQTEALNEIVSRAQRARYNMTFLIALIPDPIDSSLAGMSDQALSAIQQAYAYTEAGFLLDRQWLPWLDDAARTQRYRQIPGVLLFRRATSRAVSTGDSFGGRIETVFLVGESPKSGIHKQAFQNAWELIARLAPGEPVRIAGPSFSGSAESLRLALAGIPARPKVRIVTGSATSPDVQRILQSVPSVDFFQTVVPDDLLLARSLCFLVEVLGWPTSKVALLTESDTLYGQSPDPAIPAVPGARAQPAPLPACSARPVELVRVYFPSGLASVRTEYEAAERQKSDEAPTIRLPRGAVDLSLAERTNPVDIVRELSPLSTPSKDLAISNLLTNLNHSGFHHIGLLATDVRDKLYLARRIRELSPDATLFSLNNDLLFAHPQYREHMNGTLVLSSYPLYTEGGPSDDYRRQFGSELEQGLVRAVDLLLRPDTAETRQRASADIWIAAVGNGSIWPIAHFPGPGTKPTGPEDRTRYGLASRAQSLIDHLDFGLLFLLCGLFLLAVLLGFAVPARRPAVGDPATRGLIGFGLAALWLMGGAVLVVGTLPAALPSGVQLLLVLFSVGAFWLATAWAALPHRRTIPKITRLVVLLVAGLVGIAALTATLHWLWMPGGTEGAYLFYLRARRLSSGLSPLVSLLFLSGAFYAWALLELKRRALIARQAIEWPLCAPCEPALTGCKEMADPLNVRLRRTLPRRGSRFWLVLVAALLPPGLYLAAKMQPVAEKEEYGWLFVAAALLALALCAVSFYQFIRLWLTLDKILQRLSHSSLVEAFRGLSDEIDWKPMKSFGWQMPSLRLLMLSANKLSALDRLQKYDVHAQAEAVTAHRDRVFAARDLAAEIEARGALNQVFSEVSKNLESGSADLEVREFLAVRVVAYLRPAIVHMRNCLMATMASGLLLLAAVQTYAFQPKRFLSLGIWGALLLAVAVTLVVFLQMDRNATLSAIGKTDPGKVTFDRHFFLNVLTYGVIPLLAVIATQFPSLGREFLGVINPLLRVVGGS